MAEEDVKFSHQAYLSSYIDEIANKIKSPTTEVAMYNYINLLNTSNISLSETLALLTGKSGTSSFTKLQSHQYSSLIPKVRIYRVDSSEKGDQEYEFIFDKDTKLNNVNVLEDTLIRDNSAGIRSINWTLAGTNPVTAERNIECSIEFYFSSINAFSGGSYDSMLEFWNNNKTVDFTSDNIFDDKKRFTTKNYWALLFHPNFKKKNSAYESVNFRIKTVIGWEDIDPNILSNLFPNFPNINEELQDSNLVMYLNLIRHNFSFKEDGSVVVTAEYIATLENALFNYKHDLLKGLKEQLNRLNNVVYFNGNNENANKEKARLSLIRKILDNDIDDVCFPSSDSKSNDLRELATKLKQLPRDILEKQLSEKQEWIDALDKEISSQQVQIKNQFYNALIDRITTNNKLYSIVLNKDNISGWLTWKNNSESSEETPTSSKPTIPIGEGITLQEASPSSVSRQLVEITNAANEDEDSRDSELDQITKKNEELEIDVNSQTIYFTTIGHLLDTACDIITKPVNSNQLSPQEVNEFKRNIITFANFDEDGKNSIANIPVAFNNLLQFFVDKIYKPQKSEYSLYQFVKDVITTLVEPALNVRSVANGEINKYSNISLATTIIPLKSSTIVQKEEKAQVANLAGDLLARGATPTQPEFQRPLDGLCNPLNIDLAGLDKDDLKRFYPKSTNKGGKYFFYYIIYDKYLKEFDGKGDSVEDAKKGIYHYTIGQDYGLVKSIDFKRNDQPYLRESKSIGKKTIYLGQFRDIYAASIKMVGNNIYTPGMMLLLKPSLEFGRVISNVNNNEKPSFSQVTGVGGYYSVIKVSSVIDESGYSTNLECLFHSNEPKRVRQQSPENCNDPLLFLYEKNLQELSSSLQGIIDVNNARSGSFYEQAKEKISEAYQKTKESIGAEEALILIPGVGTGIYAAKKAYDYVVEAQIQAQVEARNASRGGGSEE